MEKKIKKYKVGTDSETYAISLVEYPAIESDFVALAEQKEEKVQAFLESDEKHLVVGAVLIPDKEIYRNDGENEYYISFTKESIEKMSQDFLKDYRQKDVTLDHQDYANEVTVVESWIVMDSYKDKANALGINVPEGTWMCSMKVNNVDVWERIKSGELKGFSVESFISIEEFESHINSKNNKTMTNEQEMNLFEKFKKWLTSIPENEVHEEEVELEGQEPTTTTETTTTSAETTPTVETTTEETTTVETTPTTETTTEETTTVETTTTVEKTKEDNSQMEELVNSMKSEIEALKTMNNDLQTKIKEIGKQPSVQPVNINSKNGGTENSSYEQWREQLRNMIG